MLHRTVALAALALVAACVDRIPVTSPPSSEGPPPAASLAPASRRPEGLARMVAKGLKNPAFRAYLKAQLDASPYREHKLQFETFLAANSGRALREVASENSVTKENLAAEAKAAIALEVYLPVPAHRAAWQGDEQILVATALTDDDPPIAFDAEGHRHALDLDTGAGHRAGGDGFLGQARTDAMLRILRGRRCRRGFHSIGRGALHDQKPFHANV